MFKKLSQVLTVVGALVVMLAMYAPSAEAAVTPDSPEVQQAITGAISYLDQELQAPSYTGMLEWSMLGYFGVGRDVGQLSAIREAQIHQGILLDANKSTDYQRTVLGALAAGENPDGYGGKQLLQNIMAAQTPAGKFADTINGSGEMLVNAHVWGIIALYAAGESIPRADLALQWLIAHQNADGGFSIDVRLEESDVDMTSMAVLALACLEQDSSSTVVQKALAFLRTEQLADGSFGTWGTPTAESCAQVVQALTMLGMEPTAEEWTKGGGNAVTGLLQFRLADGSFSHGLERLPNDMATAQALVALGDFQAGQSVYRKLNHTGTDVQTDFNDLPTDHYAYQAINDLLARQVVSGYPDGTFRPEQRVTREEFVVMLARAMQLAPTAAGHQFTDLPAQHWAAGQITAAVERGLVQGYPGNLFGTGKNITGAEVVVMLTNALGLAREAQQVNLENWYAGSVQVARTQGFIYPNFTAAMPATRAQCAYSLSRVNW